MLDTLYSEIGPIYDAKKLSYGGLPIRKRVILRYCETVSVNPGAAGQIGLYAWRANSLFDPNLTGGGHQPMGRDSWAAQYNRYVVHGSTALITFTVASAATDAPIACGLLVHSTGSPTAASATTLMEQGNSIYRIISSSSASSSNSSVRLALNFDAAKWFGVKDILDNVSLHGAAVGSNPTSTPCFVAFVQDLATAADLPVMYITAEIAYDVSFVEPMEQAAS